MFEDEKPPYIQNVSQDEEEDDIVQNIPQEQLQIDLPENYAQIEKENNIYQSPIKKSNVIYTNQNTQEDILKITSLGEINAPQSQIIQNYSQSNIAQQIEQPILEKINPPIIQNITLPEQEINIFDDKNKIFNSYSYSNFQDMNNPLIASGINENENNVYSTVYPINNKPIISSENAQYNNIIDNKINESIQQPYENNNNYSIEAEQVISQYPQYDNYNENIINSTPIPSNPNIISNFQNHKNNNIYFSQKRNYTNNNNQKDYAKVVHIDENLMKNPKIAKSVQESQMHVNNYLSKIGENQYEENILKNSKMNGNLKNSKIIKSNSKINNSRTDYINNNNFKDLNNFSPDFWKLFYDQNDPTFSPINKNIIHDQILKNTEKNEIYYGDTNEEGQKNGFGKLISPDIQRIGAWRDDKFYGWGREVRNDGKIYEGRFINGDLNGKGIYKDGAELYIGEFINYNKHGKGEIFTSSYHYVGNFNNNNMDGKGRIEIYNEGVYEGNFNGGEIDGIGIFKYKSGEFYEGTLKKGKMEGEGKLTLPNGKILEGKFVDGEYQEEDFKEKKMYTYKNQNYRSNFY